jgi:hypothetical protein
MAALSSWMLARDKIHGVVASRWPVGNRRPGRCNLQHGRKWGPGGKPLGPKVFAKRGTRHGILSVDVLLEDRDWNSTKRAECVVAPTLSFALVTCQSGAVSRGRSMLGVWKSTR